MLSGIGSNEWSLNGKTYDNLISAFENEDFVLGEDLFIGFYDWRQANNNSAQNYLMPLIDQAIAVSGSDKVDIVAHSMGGIVARSYIQSDDYRDDVDQLVMLGTPNSGSSDSYLIWEGGDLPEDWEWRVKTLVNFYILFLQLGESPPLSRLEAIHQKIPSVKELLPVYNFLVDKNSGYKFMNEVNTFLDDLNADIGTLLSRVDVTNISGSDVGTINQITVKTPDPDATKWIDGKPDPNPPEKDSTVGDNRVLLTSSQIAGATQIVLDDGKHGDLPTLAQQDVLEALTGTRPLAYFNEPDPESGLAFMAASPVEIEITDPDGNEFSKTISGIPGAEYLTETDPEGVKLIFIPEPIDGDYLVELTGIGAGGQYHLITGFADNSTTTDEVIAGDIEPGETILYKANFNPATAGILQTEAVTLDTLKDNLEHYQQEKLITKFSTYMKLKAKLIGIENLLKTKVGLEDKTTEGPWWLKRALGNGLNGLNDSLEQQYGQFIKEVEQEKGKNIDEAAADLLIEQAAYLQGSL